jgi:hypothetical protein
MTRRAGQALAGVAGLGADTTAEAGIDGRAVEGDYECEHRTTIHMLFSRVSS